MNKKCDIVSLLSTVIKNQFDAEVANAFRKDVLRHTQGYTFSDMPETEQINQINKYFRLQLRSYPNHITIDIREWLVECDDIHAYVQAFQNDWGHLLERLNYYEEIM